MMDWRIDTAKRIKGATLRWQKYVKRREPWDHEHCVGCWATFMESKAAPDILLEGYVTQNDQWVCPQCFADLGDIMELETGLLKPVKLENLGKLWDTQNVFPS